MKLSSLSVMVVFGDLAAIEQGADGAADLVGPHVRSSARTGFLQTTRRLGAPHHYRSDALVGLKLGGRYAHLAGACNQSSGAVPSGRRPRPRGRTVTNAARRGPRP
jgi:hypothetical protein